MKRGRKRLHINRLTTRMDEIGMTYPELGEKLGISLKVIQNQILHPKNVRICDAVRICNALEIPTDQIMEYFYWGGKKE